MPQIIRTISPESHAIETMCRFAETAAREGDFETADAIAAHLASDQNGRFFAEAVRRFIDRAREQKERAA
jgi:hypothetical protein